MKFLPALSPFILILFLATACEPTGNTPGEAESQSGAAQSQSDPLPSWNDGDTKQGIIDYVQSVTREGSPDFIPAADRIATFDNDGTLWSEQPLYFQLFFVIDRVKALAPDHPEWADEQPFKAILENDMGSLKEQGMHAVLELVMATHAGMSTAEFDKIVSDWVTTAKHPTKDRLYTELIYQPMLELIDYLSANDFSVYIVSGGGMEFMRVWTKGVYGIPPERVIGSTIKTKFEFNDGDPYIERLAKMDHVDDGPGKPESINKYIGRKPVFAGGNSDGDLQMLQWTDSNTYKSFQLYVHHTDADREWAYDRNSSIGKFDKALDEATAKGWTIVDMKEDWAVVYPGI